MSTLRYKIFFNATVADNKLRDPVAVVCYQLCRYRFIVQISNVNANKSVQFCQQTDYDNRSDAAELVL